MSLLQICQSVAREIPLSVPTVLVGSTDETAKLLLACAQKAGKSLARAKDGGWVAMQSEHTFSTVVGQTDYDLPSDFAWVLNDTLWDRTNYEHLRGPLSPQQWQVRRSSVLSDTSTTWKYFRFRRVSGTDKFSITPVPDAVESLVFEYMSNGWCASSGGTAQSYWQADDDVGVLDEHLIELGIMWRMLERLGMVYQSALDEYERELEKAIARDGGAPVLSISHEPTLQLISANQVPDTGFGV